MLDDPPPPRTPVIAKRLAAIPPIPKRATCGADESQFQAHYLSLLNSLLCVPFRFHLQGLAPVRGVTSGWSTCTFAHFLAPRPTPCPPAKLDVWRGSRNAPLASERPTAEGVPCCTRQIRIPGSDFRCPRRAFRARASGSIQRPQAPRSSSQSRCSLDSVVRVGRGRCRRPTPSLPCGPIDWRPRWLGAGPRRPWSGSPHAVRSYHRRQWHC